MGDFLPPGSGGGGPAGTTSANVDYERLRRRFERYRQLHASHQQQYEQFTTGIYPQQAQETQLLHKRWQETVASKKPIPKTAGAKMQQRTAGDAGMPTGAQTAGAPAPTVRIAGLFSSY